MQRAISDICDSIEYAIQNPDELEFGNSLEEEILGFCQEMKDKISMIKAEL